MVYLSGSGVPGSALGPPSRTSEGVDGRKLTRLIFEGDGIINTHKLAPDRLHAFHHVVHNRFLLVVIRLDGAAPPAEVKVVRAGHRHDPGARGDRKLNRRRPDGRAAAPDHDGLT